MVTVKVDVSVNVDMHYSYSTLTEHFSNSSLIKLNKLSICTGEGQTTSSNRRL